MNTIIINSTHRDLNSNSRFIYPFPSNTRFEAGDTIGVESIALYNSIFNVEASRSNNRFSIIWNANTSVTYNFVIPDGNYDIPALNYFIQYCCVQNGLYCINAAGNNVYFVELVIASTVYGCELRCLALPDTTEAGTLGYTIPSVATWSFHATIDQTPQVIIPTNAFGQLFGFIAGTFPASVEATSQYIPSTVTPQISVVTSLVVTCNLVNSELSNPVNVFYSMSLNAPYGENMTSPSATRMDMPIFAGTYNNVVLEFLSQTFERVTLHDFWVTFKLIASSNQRLWLRLTRRKTTASIRTIIIILSICIVALDYSETIVLKWN